MTIIGGIGLIFVVILPMAFLFMTLSGTDDGFHSNREYPEGKCQSCGTDDVAIGEECPTCGFTWWS